MRRMFFLLLALSTLVFPLGAEAQQTIVVQSCGTLPKLNALGSAGSVAIDRNGNVCVPPVAVAVSTPNVQLVTPVAISVPQVGAAVDGWDTTQGTQADGAWGGVGVATVISALKGIYNAIKTISVTTNIPTPLVVSLANTPGVTQATSPWIVQGNGPNTQVLAVTVTPALTTSVTIPTPLAVTLTNTPGVTQATSPWIVSGTVLQGTTPWTVSANALQGVFGSATVYQGTSPWTVSANSISPVQGTVTALQGTSPWIVSGTVLQGTSPWVVSASTIQGVFGSATVYQGTSPWTVSANSVQPIQGSVTDYQGTSPWTVTGTSLQGTNPWTIQPNAASTMRVNPFIPAQWGLAVESAAVPVTSVMVGIVASASESPTQGSFTVQNFFADLVGKLITSPYANRENMVRGSKNLIATANAILLPAPTGGLKNYITDLTCLRSDAGTTAIIVSTNDVTNIGSSSTFVLPNNGGGGGFMKAFNVPLVAAANTAFQVAVLTSTSGVQCSAEGFTGY